MNALNALVSRPMSPTQTEKGERFRALHARPGTFVIPNPWDACPLPPGGVGSSASPLSRAQGEGETSKRTAVSRTIIAVDQYEARQAPIVILTKEGSHPLTVNACVSG